MNRQATASSTTANVTATWAPRKKMLKRALTESPVRLVDPTAPPADQVTKEDFLPNFFPTFNGYTCHFLCRDKYKLVKIFSRAASLCRTNSIAVFDIAPALRLRVKQKIDEMLQVVAQPGHHHLRNPFDTTSDNKPIFLKLSSSIRYFKQEVGGIPEPCNANDVPVGRSFHVRAALVMKGVKVDRNDSEVSPMINVVQIVIFMPPVYDQENVFGDQCMLDEPISDEEMPQEYFAAAVDILTI